MSEKNYSTRDAVASFSGSEVIPVWKDGQNLKTTAAALLASGLPLSGALSGNVYPDAIVFDSVEMTASGALPAASFVLLNDVDTVIEAVMTPTVGQFLVVTQKDAGTVGHTLTTAGTFDGLNNTATFNAANETLVLFGVSSTRWAIIQNIGAVALTAVA